MLPAERFAALWRRLGATDDGGDAITRLAIYTTPTLRRRFEAPARSNLTRLIDSLVSRAG